jgi:iron-sulfur cluster insertion protein
MIQLTELAVTKVKEISESEEIGHTIIRLKILGQGCAGFTRDMEFNDQINETDEVIEQNGVKIIVDQISYQYLEDTTIDYVETDFGGSFKFIDPNVQSTCGCGKSVSY